MTHRRRMGSIVAGALIASLLAVTAGSAIGSPVAAAAGLGAGGEYHPVTPTRIFDTREGIGAPSAAIATTARSLSEPGGSAEVQILGLGGVPESTDDVLAVAVAITVVTPSTEGFLSAYPSGAAAGTSSIINFAAGQDVPNMSVLTVGANGKITVKLVTPVNGAAHVLVDVFGWFSKSAYETSGARLIAVSPGRIFDSRDASFVSSNGQPLGLKTTVTIPIRGADAKGPAVTDIVPNSADVVGVVLNVTGINDSAGANHTFVSVLPESPTGAVTTSNLNLSPGQIKANLVIVPVGADGAVRLYNNSGAAHLAVDVVGYMLANQDETTRLGRVIPLTAPFRAFDTREPEHGAAPLGAGQAEVWSFADFVQSVKLDGQAVGNQVAVIGNLTGTELGRSFPSVPAATYVTMYPGDAPTRPESSNINVTENVNVPNLAVVKLAAGNDQIKVYNHGGKIHYIFDVAAVVLED